ncbi:MAG: hypothetical protein M1825_004488 [Sarcosagium campestre]|nr:MAG: hypothetical protein M1825_004488 [Sarcosagium campestre]
MPIIYDVGGDPTLRPSSPPHSPSHGHPTLVTKPDREESEVTRKGNVPLEWHGRGPSPTEAVLAAINDASLGVSDRLELIERIKRGESPTWLPNRKLEKQYQIQHDSAGRNSLEMIESSEQFQTLSGVDQKTDPSSPPGFHEQLQAAADIERPRSALHSGDFTSLNIPKQRPQLRQLAAAIDIDRTRTDQSEPTSPPAPWHVPIMPPELSPFQLDGRFPNAEPAGVDLESSGSRAPSLSSFSSSFVYKAPTSPLVQSSSNADPELSPDMDFIDLEMMTSKGSRRHTLPPRPLASLQSSPSAHGSASHKPNRPLPAIRREVTFPYQAHQPRRSLTSGLNLQTPSMAQTPLANRARRPSLASDTSPLHHAPMVGSYEESILRGRMSTVPSKPLHFTAQIGVLGLGECKSNLKCPAHVTVPFPAVFYSYGSASLGRTSLLEDGPSPYVGLVDLENELGSAEPPRKGSHRRRNIASVSRSSSPSAQARETPDAPSVAAVPAREVQRRDKKIRRSRSPRAPPGGSYRVPQKGQLQIVIKNPNKTAVKLFLVPYDLQGMEAGTKTFIRQRSYSTGPIIEMSQTATASSTDSTASTASTASIATTAEAADRPTLRYLIHLHICCPSKGRFYLYRSIRVVFANRVPDGKERLRNEIQQPDPRYSAYKPGRTMTPAPPLTNVSVSATTSPTIAAEKGFRRRSSNFPYGPQLITPVPFPLTPAFSDNMTSKASSSGLTTNLASHSQLRPSHPDLMDIDSIDPRKTTWDRDRDSSLAMTMDGAGAGASPGARPGAGEYSKLSKGDVGYGGNAFAPSMTAEGVDLGESLLARRLRGLDVQRDLDRRDGLG